MNIPQIQSTRKGEIMSTTRKHKSNTSQGTLLSYIISVTMTQISWFHFKHWKLIVKNVMNVSSNKLLRYDLYSVSPEVLNSTSHFLFLRTCAVIWQPLKFPVLIGFSPSNSNCRKFRSRFSRISHHFLNSS